jgi:ferredoxin
MRIRLNLFLPALRPRPASAARAGTASSGLGLFRRALRRAGPSWLASPARRMVQAGCLALFLVLFLWAAWPYGSPDYEATRRAREIVDAELFLAFDPLAGISAALAARAWVPSLAWAALMLLACVALPRGFCGWVCPLGTLIDLFDGTLGRRVARFRAAGDGWWVHLRYYLLAATLAASLLGVIVSGFVAAIPLLTRGLLFTLGTLQSGTLRGWYLVPPVDAGQVLAVATLAGVLALGLLGPRFWCRHVCPTGAVFSVFTALRGIERKVDRDRCKDCGLCAAGCSFGAIRPDMSTRADRCASCQTCGGTCPLGAISFEARSTFEARGGRAPPLACGAAPAAGAASVASGGPGVSRRGFLAGGLSGAAAALAIEYFPPPAAGSPPVRPPGSVPEREFLRLCVRCGECFKACPNDAIQPMGIGAGLRDLWTPRLAADWSGCDPRCNNCGHVCPTGAIRALDLEEKHAARMGLAIVDAATCLPHAGKEPCRICADECRTAGYSAIEFLRVRVEIDEAGAPLEGSGFIAPVVLSDLCVGCGLCQMRCFAINVEEKRLLAASAIRVLAGEGREDRLSRGSYRALRAAERKEKEAEKRRAPAAGGEEYLPDFLKE